MIDLKLNNSLIIKDLLLFKISYSKLQSLYKLVKMYNNINKDNKLTISDFKFIDGLKFKDIQNLVKLYNTYTAGPELNFITLIKMLESKNINFFT